jgi:hypothetical protein
VKIDPILIGDRSNSHTSPFLLTFKIFNKNVHNCLVDSGASSNIMPYSVCLKINAQPQKSATQIVQLDRTKVKVLGELKDVLIRLSSNPKVFQIIDIIVVDIPNAYGLILSRDWSEKLMDTSQLIGLTSGFHIMGNPTKFVLIGKNI